MTRIGARTIMERDFQRLSHASNAKDIHQALDHIVKVLRVDASIISLARLPEALDRLRISKRSSEDLHERLLDRLKISKDQWRRVENLTQKWALLHDNSHLDHHIRPLVQDLSAFVNFQIRSFPKKEGELWDFRTFFPDVHLNYFDEDVHLILVPDPRVGANEFSIIKEMIRENDASMKVTLVLVLGDGSTLREMAKMSSIEIVVLDESDCKEIILSNNSKKAFCHRVTRRISVQALQPYQTQGKVRSRMFYGRHDEIKRVKSNLTSSFAIFGGRLIGKSSLLLRIDEEFTKDDAYQVCSITAQGFKTEAAPVEVCRVILKKLNIPTARHQSVSTFERLMRDYLLSAHSRRVLILIDEVDDLIKIDEQNNFQLFETFHNLNSDFGEYCRFIFAGYRQLAHHCMDYNSRFRNFAEQIKLGNLDPMNARLLILEPMCEELGFRFEDDSLVDQIMEISANHPNYIQVFCKELSEFLEKQQRRRIRKKDIDSILHNADFRKRVVDTFYVNFSPLQRLIVVLVILEGREEFGIPDVIEILHNYKVSIGMDDVYKELSQLEMSFVLELKDTRYRFTHKLFSEMLQKSADLDSLAYSLLVEQEAKRQ